MSLDFKGTLNVIKSKLTFNQVLGSYGVKTGSGLIKCPLHSENTGSFKIYDGDTGEGNFYCFGCLKSGDMLSFVEFYEGISKGQALNKLASKFGIDVQTREYTNDLLGSLNGILKPKEPKTPEICEELRVAIACSGEFLSLETQDLTPYMLSKRILHFGTKSRGNILIVPVFDVEDNLWNLQYIYPDGRKMFKSGGRRKGCLHRLGPEPGEQAYLSEGYATGASVCAATGVTTFISFTAGNLALVYNAVKDKFPNLNLVVAGDNDSPGRAHGLPGIYPEKPGNDWNDVWVAGGAQAVLDGLKPERLLVGHGLLGAQIKKNLGR